MILHELPPVVVALLERYHAPPRLVAHLSIVHEVALTLVAQLHHLWPSLQFDEQHVLLGAATHDVGKIVVTAEITSPGTFHEEIGAQVLRENGFPEDILRFTRTHGRWAQEPQIYLEDVLVAFADTIWKGGRDRALEQELVERIALQCLEELWQVYSKLDDVASQLAKDAHSRILYQASCAI